MDSDGSEIFRLTSSFTFLTSDCTKPKIRIPKERDKIIAQKRISASVRVRQDDDRARDAFLTRPDVAEHFVETVLRPFLVARRFVPDLILEPSAGAGAFMRAFPPDTPVLGLDIAPQDGTIVCADFLTWSPPSGLRHILVVGNPPFGKNSSLALKFVNRAAGFAEVIAMILPRTFRKESIRARLAPGWVVARDVDVPESSFMFKGEPSDVPCCFLVFVKDGFHVKPVRKALTCPDFTFVAKADGVLSFQRVGVRAGTVRADFTDRASASHYFLRPVAPATSASIAGVLMTIDWHDLKDASAGNPSIPKRELIDRYLRYRGCSHDSPC